MSVISNVVDDLTLYIKELAEELFEAGINLYDCEFIEDTARLYGINAQVLQDELRKLYNK